MPSKMVLLNTDFLNIPDEIKEEFIRQVKYVMVDKFQGTGVIITSDLDTANSFVLADDLNHLGVVAIHNVPSVEMLTPEALGVAITNSDIAFVSFDKFQATDINGLSEQIGTVASHEAGHHFLPPGHSMVQECPNLMNEGEHLNSILANNNGCDLHFTELQKAIMYGDISVDDQIGLGDIEPNEYQLDCATIGHNPEFENIDNSSNDQNFDHFNSDSVFDSDLI